RHRSSYAPVAGPLAYAVAAVADFPGMGGAYRKLPRDRGPDGATHRESMSPSHRRQSPSSDVRLDQESEWGDGMQREAHMTGALLILATVVLLTGVSFVIGR